MSRQEKRSEIFSLVEQWQQSGLNQVDFARANNLKLFTLRYWINKSRQQQQELSVFVLLPP